MTPPNPTPSEEGRALADLLVRVEKATEPDRELDEAIIEITNPHKSGPYSHHRAAASAFDWDERVTASLDAALALVERVLPNITDKLVGIEPDINFARLARYGNGGRAVINVRATGATPALALLAAMLKALGSEGSGLSGGKDK